MQDHEYALCVKHQIHLVGVTECVHKFNLLLLSSGYEIFHGTLSLVLQVRS